jgi:Bacterioferritin (cytochrome b1)
MKGDKRLIEVLNGLLSDELTAISQYVVHAEMCDAPKEVKLRHIGNGLKADKAYGDGIAKALGIALSEVLR